MDTSLGSEPKHCDCPGGKRQRRKKCVICPQAKKIYEHKCRDKEEADQNVNRNANTSTAKQIDKVERSVMPKVSVAMSSEPHFLLLPHVCHLSVVHEGPTSEAECGGHRYHIFVPTGTPILFVVCLCTRVNANSAYCTNIKKKSVGMQKFLIDGSNTKAMSALTTY